MKWLIKLICPSAESLAASAAEGIAKSVNASKEEVRAKVAKYAAYAQEATRVANRLSAMVNDGEIDKAETAEIAQMLTPAVDAALGYAFSW